MTYVQMIELDKIASSPRPVRTTWDDEKLKQLSNSIEEIGVIQPVALKPKDNGEYEIVYGHRRVAASRMAGKTRVPAIVAELDEDQALIAAFVENELRENMTVLDRARAVRQILLDNDWKPIDLQHQGIMPHNTAGQLLAFLEEYESGSVPPAEDFPKGDYGFSKALQVRNAFRKANRSDNIPLKRAILDKAAREGLTSERTREVADRVASARSQEEVQAALETDASDRDVYEQLVRAKSAVLRKKKREEQQDRRPSTVSKPVKEYILAMRAFADALNEAIRQAGSGAFSPESANPIKGWHHELTDSMAKLATVIETQETHQEK